MNQNAKMLDQRYILGMESIFEEKHRNNDEINYDIDINIQGNHFLSRLLRWPY